MDGWVDWQGRNVGLDVIGDWKILRSGILVG